MQPIYWVMSGILVGAHQLWSFVLDPNSGWTWVLSIVSLTVVVRTLMIPLFVRQINSSRAMQLVAPKARALQEKYGSDRERYGQEVMKLYKEEGVNPAASCLPLLLQMPVFLGLFYVLNGAATGVPKGHWFVTRPDLVDSLRESTIFGAKISATLSQNGFVIGPTLFVAVFLIITMTASLFFMQLMLMRKNMPPEALEGPFAQQQKMMLYLFPAIYLFTGVAFPIGVMIYWLASNLWTIGQQYLLIHNNPTPNTPAFIDWEERMRAKGKDPAEIIRQRTAKVRRKRTGPVAAGDPTQVARQGTGGSTAAPASTEKADADGSTNQRVRRQQPNRQTRANRKQARPRPSGEPTKE
ncbi:membrane protein insertase YidC [Propioniciclava sinopodophylli]|uniref:membrane protein insertase YidC n=1 Tax=Propioniciclava sinopodophylli TaxID=1837344 RepID=UPI0024915EAD|nr:membrane protein insertase YidC [Propioniciclava sinopodophylli]